MPVKAVILDVSNTLIKRNQTLVPGAPGLIAFLQQSGISIALAANRIVDAGYATQLLGSTGVHVLDSGSVGGKKGKGKFIDAVCQQFNVSRNEILYLGDSDNDMYEAVNNKIIMFLAHWANPNYPYGIPVADLPTFGRIVHYYFLKTALWHYTVNDVDRNNRPVIIRALLNPEKAKDTGIKDILKKKVRNHQIECLLSLHLLASLYLEGLHLSKPQEGPVLWCLYPSHDGAQTGVLEEFAKLAARLFRETYIPVVYPSRVDWVGATTVIKSSLIVQM